MLARLSMVTRKELIRFSIQNSTLTKILVDYKQRPEILTDRARISIFLLMFSRLRTSEMANLLKTKYN